MAQVTGSETALAAKQSCTIEIAGIRLQYVTRDPELNLQVSGASRLFIVPDNGAADTVLEFALGDLSADVTGELVFDSGATWQLLRAPEVRSNAIMSQET